MKQIDEITGIPIFEDTAARQIVFTAGMSIDADGSPFTYAPRHSGLPTLDDLSNGQDSKGRPVGYATDDRGVPYIQTTGHPAPGYYVSTTSLQWKEYGKGDPRRYIDSELFPFIALPGGHYGRWGVVLGCSCTVKRTDNGRSHDGIFADVGPGSRVGEASIRMARALGVDGNARTGGDERRIFEYRLHLELALNL